MARACHRSVRVRKGTVAAGEHLLLHGPRSRGAWRNSGEEMRRVGKAKGRFFKKTKRLYGNGLIEQEGGFP